MTKHTISLGKADYNESGRRNCEVTLEWELSADGRFSMSANIWNPRKTDIYAGGQMVDEACAFFPDHAKAQRMRTVWQEWHLNDMKAGSPAQEAWLKANDDGSHQMDHYGWACAALSAAGLNPDPGHLHNGKPYAYGSAWLRRDIPADVIAEIQSWSAGDC